MAITRSRNSGAAPPPPVDVAEGDDNAMAQDPTGSDDEWLDDGLCKVCNGTACGVNCRNVASMIVNKAISLVEGQDYTNLSTVDMIKTIVQTLEENTRYQQLCDHDLSGVCMNVTTVLQSTEQDTTENPPQDGAPDEYVRWGDGIPGLAGMIANMNIEAEGDEQSQVLRAMLDNIREQYRINANDFQNDDEKAKYIIVSVNCVYRQSSHLSKVDVLERIDFVLGLIKTEILLEIPENLSEILYDVFKGGDEVDDNLDTAATFDGLGTPFGRAYRIMTCQNIDGGNDNMSEGVEDSLADGNNDVVDNDDDEYYLDEEDDDPSSWKEEDDDDDDDSTDNETEVEATPRRIRRRQH